MKKPINDILKRLLNLISINSKKKVLKGSIWVSCSSMADNALRLVRNMLLARLLVPASFGTMAIALTINELFETFTQVGINRAVVQIKSSREVQIANFAFIISVFRGFFLYLIAFLSIPFIADFYNDPNLIDIMRWVCISILIRGFYNPHAFLVQKKMRYLRWAVIQYGGSIIGIILSLVIAIWIRNVWVLVTGLLLESGMRTFFSHLLSYNRPHIDFQQDSIIQVFKYIKGMFGLSFFLFIYQRVDIFVLRKIVSVDELGLYSLAVNLAKIPVLILIGILDDILMPYYAEKQGDFKLINQKLIQVTRLLSFFFIPAIFFVFQFGSFILGFVYGHTYEQVALPFSYLFLSKVFMLLAAPFATVYFAIGMPEKQRLFSVFRALIIITAIFPLVKFFGLNGAAYANVAAIGGGYIMQLLFYRKISGMQLQSILRPLLVSFLVGTVAYLFSSLIKNVNSLLFFSYGIIVYGISIISALCFFVFSIKKEKDEYYETSS